MTNNNQLFFPDDQLKHAQAFCNSLEGTPSLEKGASQSWGSGWVVSFTCQRRGERTVYFARLPDGKVIQRRSKRPLACVVAVIESFDIINGVRAMRWDEAVRTYRLMKSMAALPEPTAYKQRWTEACRIVAEYESEVAYASQQVEKNNIQATWGALSWRSSHLLGRKLAEKEMAHSRWESVLVLDAVGGN